MKHLYAVVGKASILALVIATLLLMSGNMSAHAQTRTSAIVATQTGSICAGTPVPNGWVVYNDQWNPTTCGSPPFISYNVQFIETYYDQALGTALSVCSYAPVPPGWTETSTSWDPTRCLHPTSFANNVMTIQRTSIGTPSINPGGVVNGTDYSANDIHPGTTVAIFGFNFYAPDLVIVTQGGNQFAIGAGSPWWFDGNPAYAQINATLPGGLTPGFATVFVQNTTGLVSGGQTIVIHP